MRRWRFLHDFKEFSWKWLVKHQKLPLSKRDGWTWSARKNFWNDFRIQNLLSKTCLGPWVSAETNGVVVRRVNPFLSHQTSGGGDFLVFKVRQSQFEAFLRENRSFERFFEIVLLKKWWICYVLRIGLWSNKFWEGSTSPKLSNKVRGVIGNRTKRFFIT